MSLILGIASSHDASACLFENGVLVSAIAEERLSRIKCDGGHLPSLAIDAVLSAAGASRRDVDAIASIYGHFPEAYFRRETASKEIERRISRTMKRLRGEENRTQFSSSNLLKHLRAQGGGFESHFRRGAFLDAEGFRPDTRVQFFDHHLTHAIAAGHYSGFDEAAVVTVDGEGDLDMHHAAGVYRNGRVDVLQVSDTPGNSPGFFYESITKLLGFRPLRHEGKILGLAAFGDPEPLAGAFRKALRTKPGDEDFDSDFAGLPDAYGKRHAYLASVIAGHARENVAAAAQLVLEESVVSVCSRFLQKTGLRNIALNGGVFANVKLNQRIARLPEVDRLFVFPGMSDTGNSVGAGLLALDLTDASSAGKAIEPLRDVYWGPAWPADEIRRALDAHRLGYEELDAAALADRAAHAIHAGKVVGWFQDRMEFGPRALGNRSMLAAATESGINKSLNDRLARTEFMPFAPSCLAEYAGELFDGIEKCRHAAEFMTVTFDVRPEWRSRVPAVVHVDGTARPQLVRRDRNPLYHALIERYRQLSGIPLVLNTSFNVHEEPIVCRPAEAIEALVDNRIDALAIGAFWAARR